MKTYCYLRVSTDSQDVANQELGILTYAAENSRKIDQTIRDTASGTVEWQQRGIGKLMGSASEGDTILVSEVSRLARSTLQVLEIMKLAAEKKVRIVIIKSGITMDGSIGSKVIATFLAMAGEIERDLISARTKEALKRRKEQGLPMGRPKGEAKALRLDEKATEIDKYIQMGLNVTAIAKLCDCQRSTLYQWLERRRGWKSEETKGNES